MSRLSTGLDALPDTVLIDVSRDLDIASLLRFSCVTKKYHQLTLGEIKRRSQSSVYFGDEYAYVIDRLGHVYSSGDNVVGALGSLTQVKGLEAEMIVTIACSSNLDRSHTLFLTKVGSVYSVGDGEVGVLGLGETCRSLLVPCKITALNDYLITAIGVWSQASFFLTNDGVLLSCGNKSKCLLAPYEVPAERVMGGLEDEDYRLTPLPVESVSGLRFSSMFVSKDSDKMYLLSNDGGVYSCGSGRDGELGHGGEEEVVTPRRIAVLDGKGITSVVAAMLVTFFIAEDGKVYYCGDKDELDIGEGNTSTPELLESMKDVNIRCIVEAHGSPEFYFLSKEGQVYCIQTLCEEGAEPRPVAQQVVLPEGGVVDSIYGGGNYVHLRMSDGSWCAKGAEIMKYVPSQAVPELYKEFEESEQDYAEVEKKYAICIELWAEPQVINAQGVEQFRLVKPFRLTVASSVACVTGEEEPAMTGAGATSSMG